MSVDSNILVYDEDCFFCSNYIRLLHLKKTIGDITFINARDTERVKSLGLQPQDLNEGIVLILGGKRYIGGEAIHRLALLSTDNSLFNKINNRIFKTHWLAVALYPLLKLGRRIYLALVGKTEIK